MATDYGSDIALGIGSAPRNWSLVSGSTNVIYALARRYRTTRGTLFYDLDYGYNLCELIGEDISDVEIEAAKIEIALEAEKDDRVLSATADVVANSDGTLAITVSVTLREGETFKLVMAVSALTIEVLS